MARESSSLNLLIVDDEKIILDILSAGLEKKGFKCYLAANAKDGLTIAQNERIHFSLLDIRLPDISGIELCQAIRRVSPSTINILMTGYPGIKTAVSGMKHAYDYLVKPFRVEHVFEVIEKIINDESLLEKNQNSGEIIRRLKTENSKLKEYIREIMPDKTQKTIQSANDSRKPTTDHDRAAESYSKHQRTGVE